MTAVRRGRWLAIAAAGLVLLLCGCSTLPTSGEVRTRADEAAAGGSQAPYFAPPGPTAGDSREGVVRGFLLAMQANPPSTVVARDFLSERARASWKPVRGTIVYDASSVESSGELVYARLSGAHRLDPRGGWDSGQTAGTTRIGYSLVREGSEWRIDNPPNALAVPASYFSSLFVPFHLYFFDRTGTVLVPTRVYLPRGQQTASNLVRGLLSGPSPELADVVTSGFPAGTGLDLGVVVDDDGVAEVPLAPAALRLSQAEVSRAVVQLAWTLRQVPGINRIRLTVDGATVPLPGGESDVSVREGVDFDPLSLPQRDLVAVVDGQVVRLDGDKATPVGGPLGRKGFALRAVALDTGRQRVAAVADSGRLVYLAPDQGTRSAQRVRRLLDGSTNLLRPVFDRYGDLWTVDRTGRGAVVGVTRGLGTRVLTVPGLSGRRLTAFAVTRDGTRLVAALSGTGAPRLLVATLVRDRTGRVVEAHSADLVEVGGSDLGPVRDVAQNGATTVAVLTRPASGPGRITVVELDGSPGEPGDETPLLVTGPASELVTSPDPDLPPHVVTEDHRLLSLASSGRWVRSPLTEVLTAAYPQ